jgi:hypothetical protein
MMAGSEPERLLIRKPSSVITIALPCGRDCGAPPITCGARRPARCRSRQSINGLGCWCLCLSTGSPRRDVTRNAALPRVDAFAMFEAGQTARRDFARSSQAGKAQANRCKRHADLLGDLQIEPLTVLLQALENFDGLFPYKNHGSDGMRRPIALVLAGAVSWDGFTHFSARSRPPAATHGASRSSAMVSEGNLASAPTGRSSHDPKCNRGTLSALRARLTGHGAADRGSFANEGCYGRVGAQAREIFGRGQLGPIPHGVDHAQKSKRHILVGLELMPR